MMGRVKVAAFTVSLDGFGAGPKQSLEHPLGEGAGELHRWLRQTKTFQQGVLGLEGGVSGPDNELAEQAMQGLGAWIMGRNMFGPVRGPWPDDTWKGWWGETPPYHTPVYVLTHHARPPLKMKGDTTFYFVTDGIESALRQAKASAQTKDIRIGGGVSVVRQYLQAGLIDELHLAYSPVFLGEGESLLAGLDLKRLGFSRVEHRTTPDALHVFIKKE